MLENNRSILDAATEITVSAVSIGKLASNMAHPDFQKNVTEFFNAIYKQIEKNVTETYESSLEN